MKCLLRMRLITIPILAFQLCAISYCNGLQSHKPPHVYRQRLEYTDDVILPGWHDAPSSLEDYPLKGGNTIINPWSYLERLGLYKIILNATNNLMPMRTSKSGEDFNFKNILWGLPVQFSWQEESGRLQDFVNGSRCGRQTRMFSIATSRQTSVHGDHCISSYSWWASMNYYLSVVPFLGAVNSGIIVPTNPLQILKPRYNSHKFCASIDECTLHVPVALKDWTDFFRQLLKRKTASVESHHGAPTVSPREIYVIESMWKAHISSLHSVISSFGEVLLYMPEPEQKMGLAWANLVDYIAATRFELDYNDTLVLNNLALPPRVLITGDIPPFIKDMPHASNFAVWLMEGLYDIDSKTDDAFKKKWNAMMCSRSTQSDARYIAKNLLQHPLKTLPKIIHLLERFSGFAVSMLR